MTGMAATDRSKLADPSAHLAQLLTGDSETNEALQDLVDRTADVLGITGAAVTLMEGDRIRPIVVAGGAVLPVEEAQEEARDGPAVEACALGAPVLVTDMRREETRWPALRAVAAATGIVAAAGIPMILEESVIGALDLYDSAPRDWSTAGIETAVWLAEMTAAFLANAQRMYRFRQTAEQLQEALDSRVVIEQAKGMLASDRKVSVDEAFKLMRAHARRNQLSLHAVAEAVVDSRELR